MGQKESKPKNDRDRSRSKYNEQYLDDEEYLKMVKRRREKDAAKHEQVSQQKGVAYKELIKRQEE